MDADKPLVGTKPQINPLIISGVVLAIILLGAGFWYWSKSKQVQKGAPSLGSELFDKTQNQLGGRVPDANPFKDQKNPLDAIYQNPFK